jgi:hypothetical protein
MITNRLFSQAYDAGIQAERARWGSDAAFRILLGQLRLDTILYERIVVVDADLFDGTFFLDASDRGLLSELPWSQIEIRTRSKTLEDSFIKQLVRDRKDYLAPYLFESMPVDAKIATTIAKSLGRIRSSAVTKLSDISVVLTDCGLAHQDVQRYSRSWKNLLLYADDNNCHRVMWDPAFRFEEYFTQQVGTVPFSLSQQLATIGGREVYNDVIKVRNSRNEVLSILNPLVDTGYSDFSGDIATIRTWYQSCYKLTQAAQHACGCKEYFVYPGSRPLDQSIINMEEQGVESLRDLSHVIAGNFLLQLGSLSVEQFEECSNAPLISSGVKEWQAIRLGNPNAARQKLKDAMKRLVEVVDARSEIAPIVEPTEGPSVQRRLEEAGAGATLSGGAGYVFEAMKSGMSKRTFLVSGVAAGAGYIVGVFVPDVVNYLNPPNNRTTRIAESIVRMEDHRLTS